MTIQYSVETESSGRNREICKGYVQSKYTRLMLKLFQCSNFKIQNKLQYPGFNITLKFYYFSLFLIPIDMG